MKNSALIGLAFLFLASCNKQSNSSPQNLGVHDSGPQVESGVRIKMPDGTFLVADIYRPADNSKHPVLLVRTPYDRGSEAEACRLVAEHGYVCITQDVRGRYASEGEWYPFKNESTDGYDTVEWAATLPYSNGQVAMFGSSYVAATQWLTAIARPPHLVAIEPILTPSNYHDGWIYQGGALQLWFDQTWTSILALDTLQRSATKNSQNMQWTHRLPEAGFPVLQPSSPQSLAAYYFDWLKHPAEDPYWKQWSIEPHYSEMSIAAYHVGGWYDIFLRGTLRNYVGMRAHAATGWARDHQFLTIGPWIHDGPMNGKAGDMDFGREAAFDENTAVVPWYDDLFQRSSASRQKRVKIFVMGINQWREEDDWPLPQASSTRYFLHSAGQANSSAGDGSLSAKNPGNEPPDVFTYDPSNPVPTRGGALCCFHDPVVQEPSGAFDQSEIEKRDDVLIYTTPAFERNFEVTGPLTIELYISSSAADTDLTAKLVDVWPNGFAQNLADNIQRLRFRNSPDQAQLLEPGKIYKVQFEVGATSNVFLPGHRVRLEISSSNFPRFDRNLNTAESPESGSNFVKARNRIYHDAEHPSAILLPVIPAQ